MKTPYDDKRHRKGCGCQRPECVELKALRDEAAAVITSSSDRKSQSEGGKNIPEAGR